MLMSASIALIAGAGQFPFHVAQEAKRHGARVIALGIQGWVDHGLRGVVDVYEEMEVGQLQRMIQWLKEQGARQAIMAGKVTKEILFDPRATLDVEMQQILSRVTDTSVAGLLGAVADRLAQHGIELLDSSTFLREALCPAGVLTTRTPTPSETQDIQHGQRAARAIAQLDIGQTVVVKRGVIVAVEALEGTDAAIRRAHQLAGNELVVVKTAASKQDRRFDLPVIGPSTIETLKTCGVSCLAMEAGSTLLLERDQALSLANSSNICLVGIQ